MRPVSQADGVGDRGLLRRLTLSHADPRLQDATASLIAEIQDVPKDTLIGDHLRRSRQTRRAVTSTLVVLVLLLAASITTASIASTQHGRAVHNAANATLQHAHALSRQLAADALEVDPTDPLAARQLAVAAWSVSPTSQAGSVMTTLLSEQRKSGTMYAEPVAVNGVAFSPDGKLLASADNDGTVRLWNPATGQAVGVPIRATSAPAGNFKGGVEEVAFSPNGKLLASASADGTTRLWNPVTGHPVGSTLPTFTDTGQGRATGGGLAFSPDSKLLARGDGDGTVGLWNPLTGRRVGALFYATSAAYIVYAVAFSPNGRLLASASADGTVRLWNPLTGKPVGAPIRATSVQGGLSGGTAFSPDSRLLATADQDGTVRLWNPLTGRPAGTPIHVPGSVSGVAFSPNGGLLATADQDGTVRLWNPLTGKPVGAPLRATSARTGVLGVAFSPNGSLLASADNDGTVRLWNPVTGQPAGHTPTHRQHPGQCVSGDVCPRWQSAGQRRQRRHRAVVEPGHRPARRHPIPACQRPL